MMCLHATSAAGLPGGLSRLAVRRRLRRTIDASRRNDGSGVADGHPGAHTWLVEEIFKSHSRLEIQREAGRVSGRRPVAYAVSAM